MESACNFGRSFLMDFVRDEKKKVAVAVSFGHEKDFRPERERLVSAEYLKRFDAISVRETSAVDILEKPSECLRFVFWIPFFPQTEVFTMRSQRNLQGEKQNRIFLPIF